MTALTIHDRGCPLCGADIDRWTLIGQQAHVVVAHSLWLRLRLFLRTRKRLPRLLIARKYDRAVRRVVWGER